ncbi:hypothetical protein OESDEN_02745 [Oesophagostomum dentatum]|uniref:Uncharacterized protein n=1 Tax=Oesophagostomum dentatum TaxID=61180 RepID=A0A0B1TIA5_OESDE|nr:hypothetical protein OESDEN_02745 [Oesophagostomum dentatum]
MICSFVLQGAAFFALVFAYEYHLERPILRTVFKKAYVEKSEVPDAPDVITERSFVRDNFSQLALAVEVIVLYGNSRFSAVSSWSLVITALSRL